MSNNDTNISDLIPEALREFLVPATNNTMLDRFECWSKSNVGLATSEKTAKQHRQQVSKFLDGVSARRPETFSEGVEAWYSDVVNQQAPGTTGSIFSSIHHYAAFIRRTAHPPLNGTARDMLTTLEITLKLWNRNITKMKTRRQKAKIREDRNKIPTTRSVEAFVKSDHIRQVHAWLDNPEAAPSENTKVTAHIRDALISEIIMANAARQGCATKMTLGEWQARTPVAGQTVVDVAEVKNVMYKGGADVVIPPKLEERICSYVAHFRKSCFVGENPDLRQNDTSNKLFVNREGKPMGESMAARAITNTWKRAELKAMTATLFRKGVVTRVYRRDHKLRPDLADHMGHREETALRYYKASSSARRSARTAKQIVSHMNMDGLFANVRADPKPTEVQNTGRTQAESSPHSSNQDESIQNPNSPLSSPSQSLSKEVTSWSPQGFFAPSSESIPSSQSESLDEEAGCSSHSSSLPPSPTINSTIETMTFRASASGIATTSCRPVGVPSLSQSPPAVSAEKEITTKSSHSDKLITLVQAQNPVPMSLDAGRTHQLSSFPYAPASILSFSTSQRTTKRKAPDASPTAATATATAATTCHRPAGSLKLAQAQNFGAMSFGTCKTNQSSSFYSPIPLFPRLWRTTEHKALSAPATVTTSTSASASAATTAVREVNTRCRQSPGLVSLTQVQNTVAAHLGTVETDRNSKSKPSSIARPAAKTKVSTTTSKRMPRSNRPQRTHTEHTLETSTMAAIAVPSTANAAPSSIDWISKIVETAQQSGPKEQIPPPPPSKKLHRPPPPSSPPPKAGPRESFTASDRQLIQNELESMVDEDGKLRSSKLRELLKDERFAHLLRRYTFGQIRDRAATFLRQKKKDRYL